MKTPDKFGCVIDLSGNLTVSCDANFKSKSKSIQIIVTPEAGEEIRSIWNADRILPEEKMRRIIAIINDPKKTTVTYKP